MSQENTSLFQWHRYLRFVLFTFALFWFDFFQNYAIIPLAKQYQWSPLTEHIASHLATIAVWGGGSYLILNVLKKKGSFDLFAAKPSPGKSGIAVSILCIIVMTALLWLLNGGIKPLNEFHSAMRRLGPYGWVDYILQNIYYICEMLVALLMCALGQKAFEQLTGKCRFPWGAIVLGILWGLPHFLSKNLVVGIVSVFFGFLLGLPYLFLNKQAKLTWLVMCLMFML